MFDGFVPVAPGCVVVVVPGWDVVVLGVPVCVPMPGLGVTAPVLWAAATPMASANTVIANRVFRIETCSLSELLLPNPGQREYMNSNALL